MPEQIYEVGTADPMEFSPNGVGITSNEEEFEVVLLEEDDPLALPRFTHEIDGAKDRIFGRDEANRPILRVINFGKYLVEKYKPVTVNGELYIYLVSEGIYKKESGEIAADVQAVCNKEGYDLPILALKRELRARMEATKVLTMDVFDQTKGVPAQNCVIQFEVDGSVTLVPYGPSLFVRDRANAKFTYSVPEFPEGDKFLKEISCDDPDWVLDLFAVFGYCLLQGNPSQKYIVLHGTGGNGKGVFIEWLHLALGSLCGRVSARELLLENKQQRESTIAKNVHKRIMVASEVGSGVLNDELLKRLTGDSAVCLNEIYLGEREHFVNATPVLVSNLLPRFSKGGKAMVRRQVAIPFEMNVPKELQDEGLLKRLATPEGNRWLLSKLILGAARYVAAFDKAGFWAGLCPRIIQDSVDAASVQDPIAEFVNSELVFEEGARTPGKLVFERWYAGEFGEVQELHEKAGGRGILRTADTKAFYDGLRANGIEVKRRARLDGKPQSNVLMNWKLRE